MKKALFAVLTALCLMLVSTAAMADDYVASVNGTDYTDLQAAINEAATNGKVVTLLKNVNYNVPDSNGPKAVMLDNGVKLDLNKFELTVNGTWQAGIQMRGNSSIVNGIVKHDGNVAAIKVWSADEIKDLTINVTPTDGKTKGGIVLQKGSTTHVNTIKNVTITGVTNGIETYECGDSSVDVIDTIDNVNITASGTGMILSAPIGTVKNSTITGGSVGVNMYRKGNYSVTADFENCEITGKDAAIWAHDEVFDHPTYNNNGDFELNIDDKTKLTATSGAAPVQEEIAGQGETAIEIEEPKEGLCRYTDANGKMHVFMKHTIEYDKYNRPYKCTVCGKHFQSAYMPETGDASSLFVWLGVLAISCAALTAKRKAYN